MKLKDLTEKIGSGATPRGGKNAYLGGDISLIRSQNVLDSEFSDDGLAYINNEQAAKLDNVAVREGDVLLNITGDSIARCCLAPKEILPARVNQHVSIIRPKKGISSQYLMYWLLFMKHHLLNICKIGGTRNALTKEMLEELDIDYPDDAQRIADALKILDTKIINNKKIIKELEDTARLIYDYWFTQFDFPDKNGKPYRSSGGKMVWNDELNREIPEGWKVVSLASLIKSVKNGDWGNEEKTLDDDIRVNCFRGADYPSVLDSYVMTAPVRYIKKKNSDRLLEDGDLIVEISGGSPTQSTGRIAYINEGYLSRSNNPMDCSNFCKSFSLKSDAMQYWFYQYWKALYDAGAMFNYEGKTTGLKNLMFDEFVASVFIAMPPISLLEKYDAIASACHNRIQLAQKDSAELASIRDWLLPMLMNGQVKVR